MFYSFFLTWKQVIDEIYRVLRFVQSTKKLIVECKASSEAKNSVLKELRANVILKELRDISSMAMEHFEEKILPAFKTTPSTSPLISFYSSSPPHFSHCLPSFVSLSPGMSKFCFFKTGWKFVVVNPQEWLQSFASIFKLAIVFLFVIICNQWWLVTLLDIQEYILFKEGSRQSREGWKFWRRLFNKQ